MDRFFVVPPAREAGFFISRFRQIATLLLIIVIVLAACTSPAGTPAESPAPQETQEPAADQPTEEVAAPPTEEATEVPTEEPASSSYPQTYTDILGRTVTVEAYPERIISLAPSVTESLFAIGAGDQVVGRTDYCNYPAEVEAIPSVGGVDFSSMSAETLLALEPDLVIGGSTFQADFAATLEEAGLTVVIVEPNSVAETMEVLKALGDLTGHPEETAALLADMQARVDAVTAVTSAIPEEERLTVFYEVWHEPLMSASNQTFIGELITLAGGVNIFGDLEEQYPMISAEQIIASDPDIILGPSSHADQLTAEIIAARPGWEGLSAVHNNAIYVLDGDILSRPGPRIVDALELIAAALYPDLF